MFYFNFIAIYSAVGKMFATSTLFGCYTFPFSDITLFVN